MALAAGFYRTQYPASYTHKSLGIMAEQNMVDIDLSQYKPFFDRIRRITYISFLSPQLWYRQQRGLCPQNYRNWEKCIQQKGEEHVYCTYYRALSEGGCGQKFLEKWDAKIPHIEDYHSFETFTNRW